MKNLWIVGRVHGTTVKGVPAWEFFGVFDTEQRALAACTGPNSFLAPATVNVRLSDEKFPWPGAYYPNR